MQCARLPIVVLAIIIAVAVDSTIGFAQETNSDWAQNIRAQWQGLYDHTEAEDFQPLSDAPHIRGIRLKSDEYRSDAGNWPTIIFHGRKTKRVLVLIHGLTDSPCYVNAIALRFATHAANPYNVVLPLLPGHGRKNPEAALAEVSFKDWRKTVADAVAIAKNIGDEVSIGGFSTGGALAVDMILTSPSEFNGRVFLFSAALDLPPIEKLALDTVLPNAFEDIKGWKTENDGIGGDPCKYSRMFVKGAEELKNLIDEIHKRADDQKSGSKLASLKGRAILVAHSEADEVIDFEAVMPLVEKEDAKQHYLIARSLGVSHSSLVLDTDKTYTRKYADERDPPPTANPEFESMMTQALAFADR